MILNHLKSTILIYLGPFNKFQACFEQIFTITQFFVKFLPLNSPGVVPVLVELRHTELDGRRGRLPHLQGDHRTGVDKASSTVTNPVVYALVGVHAPPARSVLLARTPQRGAGT